MQLTPQIAYQEPLHVPKVFKKLTMARVKVWHFLRRQNIRGGSASTEVDIIRYFRQKSKPSMRSIARHSLPKRQLASSLLTEVDMYNVFNENVEYYLY